MLLQEVCLIYAVWTIANAGKQIQHVGHAIWSREKFWIFSLVDDMKSDEHANLFGKGRVELGAPFNKRASNNAF
ncbi:hypothetical protein VNO77_43268 [Canavalia gladiata]|uniref:Uncharacterized protein n=1 Tax=Canavalia gladiata TaxID=3824 RepID=A0AAN9JUH4_CANGL